MADGRRIGRVDKRGLRIAAKLQSLSPQPPAIVVAQARPGTAAAAAAAAAAALRDDHSPPVCPKCGIRVSHDRRASAQASAAVQVPNEDPDPRCGACGQELAAAHGGQQSTATTEASSAIEFVNVHEPSGKLDGVTGSQVRAHVMRRYHQTRRKSQAKPPKTAASTKKEAKRARPCACSRHESCQSCQAGAVPPPGPMTVLGAGRSDPFLGFATPNGPLHYHELIDHCVTVLWPGLGGHDYSIAYAREWLPIAAQNAAVLNCFLFTASVHLETLRGPGLVSRKKIRIEQLYHKGEAIRGINEALTDPDYCQSDELLQNMLFLAMNESEEIDEPPDPSPFISPLQNVQWLDVYGNRSFVMSHVYAVQEMVRRRGGLRNIKKVGLPWLISFSELIYCAAALDRPEHPLLDHFGRDVVYHRLSMSRDAPTDRPNQGFRYLQAAGLRPDVTEVFLNLQNYSEAVEAYSTSSSLPDCLAGNRNWLQHRLLSLPSAAAVLRQVGVLSRQFHHTMLCFEACRLAALMYSVHVTFPVPRPMGARRLLLPQMKEAIRNIPFAAGDPALRELVFWCVVIGGIAAAGQPERSWFAVQLVNLSASLGLRTWSDAKVVLRNFAWLESACQTGGANFWDEVL